MTTSILILKLNFINQGNEKEHVKISNTAMFHKRRLMIDLYHGKDSSYKAWPDTKTKHTTGKSKPKLVSGPMGPLQDLVTYLPTLKFKTWHFVSTANEKSRKK